MRHAVLLLALALALAPGARAASDDPTEVVERVLAAPPATGLVVVSALEESQAATKGVRPGDTVVAYGGEGVTTPEALAALKAKAEAAGTKEIPVALVAPDGTPREIVLAPGSIGVVLLPVEKGKPVPPLPPATKVRFDVERFLEALREDW